VLGLKAAVMYVVDRGVAASKIVTLKRIEAVTRR